MKMIEHVPANAVHSIATSIRGSISETFATQETGLPGLGEDGQNGDKFGDTLWTGGPRKIAHAPGDGGTRFAGKLDAAFRARKELADGTKFGDLEKIAAEAVVAKLEDHRMGVPTRAAPVVRQVRADENEVAGAEGGDAVADKPQTVPVDNEREFVFGMNMPRRSKPRQVEFADDK